jgi:transcription antitermination protein NusB
MSNRHLARTVAMQTLFEWDFNHHSEKLNDVLAYNIEEQAAGLEDSSFIEQLVRGVNKNQAAIDALITSFAANWTLDKIMVVDRNILRLAIYELKFAAGDVPPRVIINEAIEMAKNFGGESSGKFVNGVLGAIYNDMAAKGEIKEESAEEKKE